MKPKSIPFGLCHCGCGERTKVAPQSSTKWGYVRGKPMRFIYNHYNRVNGISHLDWLIKAVKTHDSNECLLWPFSIQSQGYGTCHVNGRHMYAHRYAFFIANGHLPNPCACHTCDVRACINPRHLFEGTIADNSNDASRKLRLPTKTTPEIVAAMRRDYVPRLPGRSGHALARKYGLSQATVAAILRREIWKFVE